VPTPRASTAMWETVKTPRIDAHIHQIWLT